uniref:Uncharacterized protein n=1 Tax=Rhizophora mucronata TaxID=61149 RepID=A0A2P2JPM9_RHIMU
MKNKAFHEVKNSNLTQKKSDKSGKQHASMFPCTVISLYHQQHLFQERHPQRIDPLL